MTSIPPTETPIHGGQLQQIAAYFGIQSDRLLDFSANINPAGSPHSALAAIRQALADPTALTVYPDLELTKLKHTIAGCSDLERKNIAVANGFVPLLEAALRSLKIERCLLPVPSFSEYRRTLENADITIIPFQLSADREFQYEPETLFNECLDRHCDAILLANPQNPSGALCEKVRMHELIERAQRNSISVLLDEAFIDYCPDHSLAKVAVEQQRMIVFRSVTKFFAIPGLRAAYAIGNSSVVDTLNRTIAPWPITSLASDAVCAALLDEPYADKSRLANGRQRLWLEHELARLNIKTYPSRTNFLLLRFPESVDVVRLWQRMIVDHQIVLRSCANFEALAMGHLRIAVRSESDNKRLIRGLERALMNTQL